ncbi:MAG: hypothetical protein KBA95_19395 [Acidobacteria bacterium]|nr:hypothetical protein [Acidobacteriota bacterium]
MPEVRATAGEREAAQRVYREGLDVLDALGLPFLVGGAYAFARYTGIERFTKDFDVFVDSASLEPVLGALAAAGFSIDRPFPHWLAKAYRGGYYIDVIYSSGNGIARVDDRWFEHAVPGEVLERPVRLVPPEEMLWSKSFIMERERYDGADIAHLLRALASTLDWRRLIERFGGYWRVLLSHAVLFGFVYPGERDRIPAWVMETLVGRLEQDLRTPSSDERICQGTILSRQQYLPDVELWGYHDARVFPRGHMSADDTATWTAAIGDDK